MAANSCSDGLTQASESLVALTIIMKRMVHVSFGSGRPFSRFWAGSTVTSNERPRNRHGPNNFFLWLFGVALAALFARAFGERGLQLGDAPLEALVLLAGLLRHGLDRFEFLALHHVEVAQHPLGLGADHALDLLAHALCRAGSVGDELAELVEEPASGLCHGGPVSISRASEHDYGMTLAPAQPGERPCPALTGWRRRSRVARSCQWIAPAMDLLVIPYPVIDPVALEIGPVSIRWYGLAYMAGILLGWLYGRYLV